MKQIITILHAQYVDFIDAQTQRSITGVNLRYIDSLIPCGPDVSGKIMGTPISRDWLDSSKWDKLMEVPGNYVGEFATRIDKDGHRIQKLIDIEYDGSLMIPHQ